MKQKNTIFIGQQDREIRIDIKCTSVEMADKIFSRLEALAIQLIRNDLEDEWKEND